MRSDVGHPSECTAVAVAASDQQRMAAFGLGQARQYLDIGPALGAYLVQAEQSRPRAAQAAQDRVICEQDLGDKPFRHLDSIIERQAFDREGLLDRCACPARATVDPLKAQVAADHDQATALGGPTLDEL